MHEMGIAEGILSAALEVAKKEGAERINEVRVTVGDLTEVLDTALEFGWEVVRQETMAAESKLLIEHLPGVSVCGRCSKRFEHDRYDMTCPDCGNFICECVQGRELRIDSIDID